MTPIYIQLADLLRDKIYAGTFSYGEALPSERKMAADYGISHVTVRKALDVLAQEKLIIRVQGKGNFVTAGNGKMNLQQVESLSLALRRQGVALKNELIHKGIRKAGYKYAAIFDIAEDDEIFCCVRLRKDGLVPLMLEYNYVPLKYAPNIDKYDLSVFSLYDVYRDHNILIVKEEQRLDVIKIFDPQARYLELSEESTAFLLTSFVKDDNDRTIEYSRIYDNDKHIIFHAMSAGELSARSEETGGQGERVNG